MRPKMRERGAGTVYLICGKICSGKSRYAAQLQAEKSAVRLSCDEIENDLFHHDFGERHDAVSADIKRYLHKKAAEIARAGCPVVLDWGFWTRAERKAASAHYRDAGIPFEWHYVEISDSDWRRNIASRNAAVAAGETTDYAVDSGLLEKLESLFEPPTPEEACVLHRNTR